MIIICEITKVVCHHNNMVTSHQSQYSTVQYSTVQYSPYLIGNDK
jgi:hypothetical protein